LAGNPVKPLLSLYGTEWRERGYGLWSRSLNIFLNSKFLRDVGSGEVHKSGGGRGRSLSVFENSDVDKEVGNALRKVKQQVGTTNSPVAGVLNEPYSAKPAQRSSHTARRPTGYIGWTWFQPMYTGGSSINQSLFGV
jgi:hypothetical protein